MGWRKSLQRQLSNHDVAHDGTDSYPTWTMPEKTPRGSSSSPGYPSARGPLPMQYIMQHLSTNVSQAKITTCVTVG